MTATLDQQVREYLRLRRALGFKLEQQGRMLAKFAAWLQQQGAATVTAEHAIEWAQLPQGVHPVTWTHRLSAIRSFATWLATIDPAAQIPPRGVFPGYGRRPAPFIWSGAGIAAMVSACGSLRPPMRAATYTALFGLIAVTGIRIGEARTLTPGSIDLDAGLLTVSPAKSRCERILPLHPSTVQALAEYAALRGCKYPAARTFFVSTRGTMLRHAQVMEAFRLACADAGPGGPGTRPRVHDLRHSFAVTTLLGWYWSGQDIAAQMPALSGYLGHVRPEGTYWYISAVPELMQLAAARLASKETCDE